MILEGQTLWYYDIIFREQNLNEYRTWCNILKERGDLDHLEKEA